MKTIISPIHCSKVEEEPVDGTQTMDETQTVLGTLKVNATNNGYEIM